MLAHVVGRAAATGRRAAKVRRRRSSGLLINCCRIGSQDLERRALFAELGQCRGDRRIGRVADEVDEEEVFPEARARRSRLEPRHGDAVRGERLEQLVHGARADWAPTSPATCRRDPTAAPRCGPAPRTASCCWARPRCATRACRGRRSPRHCRPRSRRARLPRRRAARLPRCSPRDARRRRQVAPQPLGALRQRLRVRVDPRHSIDVVRLGQEVLADAEHDLAADRQRRLAHEVERAADRAFGGVLHRHDREVGLPALRRPEDLVDRRAAARASTNCPKCLATAVVRERAGRTEVRHAQRLLEREAGRHDCRKSRRPPRSDSGPGFALQAAQHLRLAFGAVGRRRPP